VPPEPEPDPEVVAPVGAAPPPVAPLEPLGVPPDVPPDVPPPLVPPDVPDDELPLPDVPDVPDEALPLPDGALPLPDDADVEGEPPLDDEVAVVLLVEVVEPVVVAGADVIVCVGTVNGGAPDVSVAAEPPPHAASATQAPTPAATVAMRPTKPLPDTAVRRLTTDTSDFERLHAPPAVRAVVEVLLAELVAPVAKAKVLHGPGQLGGRRGERQQLRDHLERLAGLAIEVGLVGLGIDHDLSPGRRRPHPVPLAHPH
jgi:hypothetical protein